jgi:hypothetical protein
MVTRIYQGDPETGKSLLVNSAARADCQNDERRRERPELAAPADGGDRIALHVHDQAVPWHDVAHSWGPTGVRAGNSRMVVRPVVGEVPSMVPGGGRQQARRCTRPRPAAYSGLLKAAFGWPRRTPTVRRSPSKGPVESATPAAMN